MTALPTEPIAVLGLSCRLPGADGPEQFWRLLHGGGDAITEAGDERWPRAVLPDFRRGGFLEHVDTFDAEFFGIDPAEAAAMDPQQRLALELGWHALEDARIVPATLGTSAVGVFAAAVGDDYALLSDRRGWAGLTRHSYPGTFRAMIANRLSYALGLHGPSLTVDTGQSSSLVAVHLACESLRRGESEIAIAGGVHLNLLAETTLAIGEFGALSPDGQCHVFDARANGYVRGEGGALVVLKPLAAALRDGDPVRCVILGSAVNNDGGGDTLTAPTVTAQRQVIERAHAQAGIAPAEVGYVELHGTGTRVGDPVEANALGSALGHDRHAEPLLVGSVKGNIGHLEAAAGIAGLVKAVLAIEHGELPATVGYETPNPDIPLDDLGLSVVSAASDWPHPDRPRVAGVSSFGMGGTNCHLVLRGVQKEGPLRAASAPAPSGAAGLPWLLSARTPGALRAQARALTDAPSEAPVADIALALVRTRAPLARRAALLGADPVAALAALATGAPSGDVVTGAVADGPVAFVFPGQGSQWAAMARQLIGESAVFAAAVDECAGALADFVDWSVHDVLTDAPGAADLGRVDVVQPALWVMLVSLARVWRAAGVRPELVIGHSQGEIAAATAIGALSLADGARVVALRSQALAQIAGTGGMLSVAATPEVAQQAITDYAPAATLAALNGPSSVVLSGTNVELGELQGQLTIAGYRTKLVPVDYASHSAVVERLRDHLRAVLAPVRPRSVETAFVSTLTGAPMDTAGLDAEYWYAGLREPVRFEPAVRHALAAGCRRFVECSPHPVLTAAIEETADAAGNATVIATLRREQGGADQFRRALAEAWVAGAPVDWLTWAGADDRPVAGLPALPRYPFERSRFWLGDDEPGPVLAAAELLDKRSPAQLLALVLQATGDVLGRPEIVADPTTADREFKDLGVDSATAIEIRNRLRTATGLALAAGVLFDHPSAQRLADHLHERVATDPAPASTLLASRPPVGADEPIAIIGIGCRYPGAIASPDELWTALVDEVDAITGFPTDRGWDLAALADSSATAHGGFLTDVAGFDATFFGISPREASAMDPQQRVFLTVCWEALERAGIDPGSLRGSPSGVFVGAMAPDYGPRLAEPAGQAEGHLLTGTALSVISGRVAYTLGLEGPALTVDTACSASLVALHLAGQALRRGECTLALAGGVTVMATPGMFVEFSRQGGLSPDGRCKAFAAGADGTGWAEGAGVLVLERLSDAQRNGRRILGVVHGSAVNQDGRSNGLTAPNGPSQERVIRQALSVAGIDAGDVVAVEAHGTGTELGDPIEAQALLDAYGLAHRPERPLWLGSIKSNLGHTQAAAGVAGVIKMVQALRHHMIPATLHAAQPTPHVDWSAGRVRLVTEPVEIDPGYAAVSSFGISGTNAHVILGPAPDESSTRTTEPSADHVWTFSARTPSALRSYARRLAAHAEVTADPTAVAHELASRARFEHRAVVVAADRAELTAALTAVAEDRPHPVAVVGNAATEFRPVFVFPGQGSQWAGMARALLDESDVFWESMCRCDGALAPHIDWSVLDVVRGEPGAPELAGSAIVQPVLFAVMVSLAALWRAAGVEPTAVLGHSQGEITAACVAGALSLDDAARIVVRRSRALTRLDGSGGMTAVSASATHTADFLEPWQGRLWIAIHSAPDATVVAGDLDALAEFEQAYAGRVQLRRVGIDYAAHTPHIEALHDELADVFAGTAPHDTEIAICSSLAGGFVSADELDADYWYRGLRHPVLFTEAVSACDGTAPPLFIEASPHPTLTAHVDDTLHAAGHLGATIGTLRRGSGDFRQFLRAAAEAFVRGAHVDWAALLGTGSRSAEDVPTYPFEQRRYWLTGTQPAWPAGVDAAAHPLFDAVVALPNDERLLTGRLSRAGVPWLAGHVIGGATLLPGTAAVELAGVAGRTAGCPTVAELTLEAPLPLPDTGAVQLRAQLSAADQHGHRRVTLHARTADEGDWLRFAAGSCTPSVAYSTDALTAWPPSDAREIDLDDVYPTLAERGYEYGAAFQGLHRAWRTDSGGCVEVRLPDAVRRDAGRFTLHPALLDAALHALVLDRTDATNLLVPFSWSGVTVATAGADALRVVLTDLGDDRVSLAASAADGSPVAAVAELALRRIPRGTEGDQPYTVQWVAAPSVPIESQTWALVGDDGDSSELAASVRAAGLALTCGYDLASLPDLSADGVPDIVLVPSPVDSTDPDAARAVHDGLPELLDLVQTFTGDDRFAHSRLVLLTRPGPATGAAEGLLRTARTEHPDRFALAELPADFAEWRSLGAALAAGETELRSADGTLQAPRLRPAPTPADPSGPLSFAGRTVLITGGTGGLGALLAEHLVTRYGADRLLLVSRHGPAAPGAAELITLLGEHGAHVDVVATDVADRRALDEVLDAVPEQFPLGAVVHAAGVRADASVDGLGADQLDVVLAPKVDAAWHLHERTADLPLSAFVLFSSAAGVLGTAGQANYAGANAFLDRLAEHRHAQGLPAVSIAWGLWQTDTGLTGQLTDTDRARLARAGLAPLPADTGLALFDAALCGDHPVVVAARWARDQLGADAASVLRELAGASPGSRPVTTAPGPPAMAFVPAPAGLATQLGTLAPAAARARLLDEVRSQVAQVLAFGGAEDIDPDRAFTELGFDSLTVVELRNRLDAVTGQRLPATLAFDHPTVRALAEYLAQTLLAAGPTPEDALREALDTATHAAGDDADLRHQVVAMLHGALGRLQDGTSPVGARLDAASDAELLAFLDEN